MATSWKSIFSPGVGVELTSVTVRVYPSLHVRDHIVALVKDDSVAAAVSATKGLSIGDREHRLALVCPGCEAAIAKVGSVPDQLSGVVEDRGSRLEVATTGSNEEVSVVGRRVLDEVEEDAGGQQDGGGGYSRSRLGRVERLVGGVAERTRGVLLRVDKVRGIGSECQREEDLEGSGEEHRGELLVGSIDLQIGI